MTNFSNMWNQSNCLSKGQLIGYIRQTLDRDEVYLVESHLNDCQICSDALDGLMEEDLDIAQQDISDIKSIIETKIKQVSELKQPTTQVQKNIKPTSSETTLKVNPSSSNRNRWMIAASILAVISLGGYTVYSYLKSHPSELAINKNSGKGEDVKYNKPNDPNANEITTITVAPPENQVPPTSSSEKEDKKSAPPLKAEKSVSNKDEDIKESTPPPRIQTATKSPYQQSINPVVKEIPAVAKAPVEEDLKATKEAMKDKVSEPDQGMSNYFNDTKKAEAETKVVAKKKGYGMSNSKLMPATQNARELSYPASSNNNLNNQNAQESSNDDNLSYSPKDDYTQAMELYNQGEFKASIRYFENALKKAEGVKKEDIQYQLALAYEKTGKDKKAKQLFEMLAQGTKYKKEASDKLIKLTK